MSQFLIASEENLAYLAHHGIQGQKWGIRRFQYEDGSLTPEGMIRYGVYHAPNSKRNYGIYGNKDQSEQRLRDIGKSVRKEFTKEDKKTYKGKERREEKVRRAKEIYAKIYGKDKADIMYERDIEAHKGNKIGGLVIPISTNPYTIAGAVAATGIWQGATQLSNIPHTKKFNKYTEQLTGEPVKRKKQKN